MLAKNSKSSTALKKSIKSKFFGCAHNDDGATAIEFAMVAMPFFMLVFGMISVSNFYFMNVSVEKGMDMTGRLVRTGQAQANNMTVGQFKNNICTEAGGWIKCNNLQLFVQSRDDWSQVTPENCVDNAGVVRSSPMNDSDLIAVHTGSAQKVVVVTACYKWELASRIPFLKVGDMSDGSKMIQTVTAFKTEPYQPLN
jgi:Flp pilus assembly protein TadG